MIQLAFQAHYLGYAAMVTKTIGIERYFVTIFIHSAFFVRRKLRNISDQKGQYKMSLSLWSFLAYLIIIQIVLLDILFTAMVLKYFQSLEYTGPGLKTIVCFKVKSLNFSQYIYGAKSMDNLQKPLLILSYKVMVVTVNTLQRYTLHITTFCSKVIIEI